MRFRAREFLWILALLASGTSGKAQTADQLLDDNVVQELRLFIHPTDWTLLHANFLENTYYPAELSWRGVEAQNIGVRSRGFGSRSGIKPALEVDFNRYVKDQEFLGLTSLVLKNAVQDPSFLRERLSMLLFRRMGIPAPREAYARLYVNDQFAGLYLIVEPIDKKFLRRNFGEDEGYLYEYRWIDNYYFQYLGENPKLYSPVRFEPRTREEGFDPATIEELVRTINFSSDGDFIPWLSQFLDVRLFLKFLAVENFMDEADGLLGIWGMNNFYLYRLQHTRQFQFIPWDREINLLDPDHHIWFNADTNVLTNRLIAIPEFYGDYSEALKLTALEAGGSGGWLELELERAYAQIRSSALEDPIKPATNEGFEEAVDTTREFVRSRRDFVIREIETGRTPWD